MREIGNPEEGKARGSDRINRMGKAGGSFDRINKIYRISEGDGFDRRNRREKIPTGRQERR
jgi:hypothetical protein